MFSPNELNFFETAQTFHSTAALFQSVAIADFFGIDLNQHSGIPMIVRSIHGHTGVELILFFPRECFPNTLPFQFIIYTDAFFLPYLFEEPDAWKMLKEVPQDIMSVPGTLKECFDKNHEYIDGRLTITGDLAAILFVIVLMAAIFQPLWVWTDAPYKGQFGFQDPATAVMEAIINFHHDLFFFLVMVVVFVGYLLGRCIYLFNEEVHETPDDFVHGTVVEVVWTITPALILVVIAIPSFSLLYSMDEVIDPQLTVKAIGHQWYWSYEYSDYDTESGVDINYDSYMITDDDWGVTVQGRGRGFRLLEARYIMLLPVKTHVRLITTSADVIHSWTVPSFGVKLDACPGRLNQTSIYVKRMGKFFGQCSEICGVNHGFMPISVVAIPTGSFVGCMELMARNQGTHLSGMKFPF